LGLVTHPTPINQHLGWQQPLTPLIIGQSKVVPYPMWYNTIPHFIPMNPNMYSMHNYGIKRLDPFIFGRREKYVAGITQEKLVPLVEQLE